MEILLDMPARFRLAELLEESGLSQRELAARSKVSPTTINRMANNLTGQVSLKTLDALARALSTPHRKVRPGDLIEEVSGKKGGRG
jgi:transcriptional regulator with XRE-family HTH domain